MDISKGKIYISQEFFLLDFELQFVHRSKISLGKLIELENTNTIDIIRQTKYKATYLRLGVLRMLKFSFYATSLLL